MIHIVHLYPRSMNTYGDTGNIICLRQRCQWRNIEVTVTGVEIGDEIPKQADLYFIGGGQDAAQMAVAKDLQRHAERLTEDTINGVPSLSICGGYQLFGRGYVPFSGERLPGIGIFPAETFASNKRMIGNIVINIPERFSNIPSQTVVGFENHSGQTHLDTGATPFGSVLQGFGNNGDDKTEGCIVHNAVGCYIHGSVLPKNPQIADWLLGHATNQKLLKLDDTLEMQTHRARFQPVTRNLPKK